MRSDLDVTAYPGNIINNELVPTRATRHSIDPATGAALYEVPVATREDLDAAVRHAQAAFPGWAATAFAARAALVLRYADAVEAHREALQALLTREQGKPAALARTEFDMALAWLRAFAAMELRDEVLDDSPARTVYATHAPIGVAAGIVPWNWPVLLGLGKMAPALLTGNCFIMKPSPYTPYVDLKLGELGMAVFPPGVFQVLSGDDALGPWVTEHPGIGMVAFTGSIATGRRVAVSCARSLKRCVLELGGNDPCIVCEDVDLDKCVPKIATLAFLNTGQICMLPKRIYVHEKIYDQFRAAMVDFTRANIKTGGGFEPDVVVGPLQNRTQFEHVKELYAEVERDGLAVALAGGPVADAAGYLVTPCIVDDPPEGARVVAEEAFGPIVPLLRWADEADVVARANGGETGLGASVWSRDVARAERLARRLAAGSVWVNSHFDVAPGVPFGGHKASGLGREWGREGLKAYTNTTSLWVWKTTFD